MKTLNNFEGGGKTLGQRNELCLSYTIEINQLQIFVSNVKMNHFEVHYHLMVSSRVRFQSIQDGHSV